METESAGGPPCSPNISPAASSRRKQMGREAPKLTLWGLSPAAAWAQGSSWGGVSCALPTPGPCWPPPLVLPEAVGALPSGVSPRGLSTFCWSTDDIRNRTRRVQILVIYRKREGAVLALKVSNRDVPMWLIRPFGKRVLMGHGRPATAPPCPQRRPGRLRAAPRYLAFTTCS